MADPAERGLPQNERENYIKAISRLMMLYDVGKVLHSTLELGELAPLILQRVESIVEADAAAVWLLDPAKKNLYCTAVSSSHRALMEATRVWASDPGLGSAAAQGDAVLLTDVDDPAWISRWQSKLRGVLAVPLQADGRFLGAIEAVRAESSEPFAEEDLRLLIDVAKQASVALRNAQRYQAERRVKEMHALNEISQEITATLDLDRVLTTTVNRITSVIPADRCSISLMRKGELAIDAISGESKVDRKSPPVRELEAMHTWLSGLGGDLSVVQTEAGVDAEHEDVREKFKVYFERTGMRALTGLLLRDEEGIVGVLGWKAGTPNRSPRATTNWRGSSPTR